MKYLLPILAALYCAAATASVDTKHHQERPKSVTILPREHYNPLKCKTHHEHVGTQDCEWSECRNEEFVWTDDLMRCAEGAEAEASPEPAVFHLDGKDMYLPVPAAKDEDEE